MKENIENVLNDCYDVKIDSNNIVSGCYLEKIFLKLGYSWVAIENKPFVKYLFDKYKDTFHGLRINLRNKSVTWNSCYYAENKNIQTISILSMCNILFQNERQTDDNKF